MVFGTQKSWQHRGSYPKSDKSQKKLRELKQKEKLNPKDDAESRMKNRDRFDSTDTLLTETEQQAVENNLVEYHHLIARYRKDIEMNTEIKLKLTPNVDRAVCSQNFTMPIQLRKELIG